MGDARLQFQESIRILEKTSLCRMPIEDASADFSGYVSIGSGEIRITILDTEGMDIKGWIAVVGWSSLILGHQDLKQSEAPALSDQAGDLLRGMMDTILMRTLDRHPGVKQIVIASPYWMHGLVEKNLSSLRDKISPILMETIV